MKCIGELLGRVSLNLAWSELIPCVAKQVVNIRDGDGRQLGLPELCP